MGLNVYVGSVTDLPGCPDIAVSHAVYKLLGNTPAGEDANRIRLKQLQELGYSGVLCTVNDSNRRQIEILESNGWTKCDSFLNMRTDHTVSIYFYSFY